MVLSLFGIPSIAPQGENTLVPQSVVDEAKKRFKTLVMLYDYDDAGVAGATKAKEEYEIPTIYIPKPYLELYNVKDVLLATSAIRCPPSFRPPRIIRILSSINPSPTKMLPADAKVVVPVVTPSDPAEM